MRRAAPAGAPLPVGAGLLAAGVAVAAALLRAGGVHEAAPRPPDTAERPPAAPSSGGLLAYECTLAGNSDVCVVPVTGGPPRRLTRHAADDMWPRFTPDGRRVVFSSERGGTWQLWEVDVAGGAERRLRSAPAREWQSDVSPDGRRLAFLSDAGGEESLRVARLGGRGAGRLVLTHGPRVVMGNPDWSPDGRSLVISSNAGHTGHHVYLVDVQSGQDRRISPLLSGACEPRFSPDGREVTWVRRRRVTREKSAVVAHTLATGEERVLVDWPALNYDPVLSPDGTELAFTSTVAARGADEPSIYRLRLSDGRSWRVTFDHPARHPDYQPR